MLIKTKVDIQLPFKAKLLLGSYIPIEVKDAKVINLENRQNYSKDLNYLISLVDTEWILYIKENEGKLEKKVYRIPKEIDQEIAKLKLDTMGIKIDKLTPEQEKYLTSWQEGTE